MAELEERNKALLRQFVGALNGHDLDALDHLVAPDFVRHCRATPGLEVRSLAARALRSAVRSVDELAGNHVHVLGWRKSQAECIREAL
jgi:hypothetical protein